MAAASAGTLPVQGASVPLPGPSLAQQQPSQQQQQQQQHSHQVQQQTPLHRHQQQHLSTFQSGASVEGLVVSQHHQSQSIYHHQQQASVVAPNLVSGWRRLVTNGDIVYISPSGEALRTIGQIKDYLLSSGTCKCGLPCPFRPELFFNFNSQIPNSLLPTASSDRSASSTCLHQQRLLEKTKTILAKDVTIKRRKLAQGEWQGTTSTSLQHLSQDESMVKQRHIVTKFGPNQGHQLYHHNAPNYVTHPLQQPPQQQQQQHQVVNNLVVGQSITAGSLPNQTVNIVTGNLGQQQQHLQSQQSQQHPGSSSQGGGVNRQSTTASTFQTVPCSTVNSSNNLISGNNVIQSGNNVRTNLSGSSGSSSNSTSNVNQIIGLNPTISNISSNNSNSHTNANHNNVVIESVNHHHQQQHHHHAAQLAGGSLQGQQQQQQHHMQHQAASSVLYQQSQHPTRISSGTGSLMVTSYATTIAGGSSLKPSNAITTTSTFSNLQLSKSPPWRRNSSAMHQQQQQQQQQQNQIQVSYERVPPLPQQHLVSQPPPWQEENQKRIMKVRSSPSMINPVTKKRPNFKDDPTGYLDHQTAILHSSILGVPSPDLVDNAAEQATNRISEQEYQVGVKAKPKQQMVQSQRPKANPTIIEMGNFTIGGQTVTHLPNGMVQVQQNCDVLQAQQLPIVRSNTSTTPVTQTVTKQSDKGGQQPMLVQASQESPVSSSTAFTEKRPSSRSEAGLKGPVQGGTISTSNDSPASFSASPLSCASPSQSPDLQINRNASTPSTSVQKTYAKVVHKNPVQPQKISGKPTIMQQKLVMENQMKINEIPNQNPIIITQVSTADQAQHTSNVVSVQSHQHQQQQQQHHQIFVTDANGQTQQRLQPIVQNCIPMGTNISSLPGSQFVMTTSGQIIVVPPKTTLSSANANGLITTASNQNILISNGSHHTNTGNVIIQNSPHQGQIINTINGNAIVSGNLDLTDQSGRNVVIPGAQNATTIQIANPSGNSVIINQQPQNGAAKIIGQSSLLGTSHHHHHHQQHHHHHQNQILTTNNGTVTVLNTMPSGFVIQPTGTNQIIQQHTQATATIDGQHVIGQLIDTGNGTQQFIQTTNLQQLGGNRVVITSPDNQLKRKTKKRKSSSGSSTPSLSPQNSPPILSPQQPQQPVIQITPTPQYSQSFQISPGIPQLSILPNGGNSTTTATVAKAITSNTGQPTHQQILLPNGQTILQPLNLIQQQVLVPAGLVMTPDNTLLQIQNMAPCSSILTPQGVMIRAQSPQNKSFLSPNSGQQFIVTNQASGQISPQQLGHIYSTPMGLMMPQHQQQSRTFVQQSTATIVQQPTTIVTSQHQQQHHHQQQVVETPDRHQGGHILQQQQQHHSLYSGSASPPDTTTHSPQSPERPESQRSGGSDSNMVQCVSSSEPDSVTIIPNEQTAESPSSVLDYERQQIGSRNKEVVKIRRVHQTSVPNQQQPSSYQRSVSASYSSSGMVVSATSSGMNNGGTSKTGATMRPDSRESSSSGGGGGVVAGSSGNSNSDSLQRAKFAVGELVWGAAKGHPAWPGKIVPGPSSTPLTGEELNTMTWVRWFGGRPIIELVPVDALKSLSEGLEAHHRAQKETRKSRKLNTQLERAIQEAMADLDTAETKPILQSSPSRGRPNKQSELSSSGGSVVRKEKLKFNKSSRAFSSSQLEEFVSSSSSSSSKAVPIRSKPPIKIAPAGEKLLRNHQAAAIVDK